MRISDWSSDVCSSDLGLKQLRIAETEKYAHVTFFFSGGREDVFDGEERILIPSPKVATYDLQPEMSCPELTAKLVEAIGSGRFDLVVCNIAYTDMVGPSAGLQAELQEEEAAGESDVGGMGGTVRGNLGETGT